MSPTLFISDLHLCAERPAVTNALLGYLEQWAADAEALYVLGDLFEHWVGDDVRGAAGIAPVVRALAAFGASHPLYFMHGNRDFLLGDAFATAAGGRLIPEGTVLELGGDPVLLLHGDDLCTDDTEHQRWRRQVRTEEWQREFLAKPLAERLAIAAELRRRSEAGKKTKPAEIMDVNTDTVVATMRAAGTRTLVHGHTHRPARHAVDLGDAAGERIVLGDWDSSGWVLEWRPDSGFDLRELAL